MSRPLLNPPCTGWKEDLPAPECSPLLEASLGKQAPNFQDCVYLEVPRSAMSPRGIVSALAIILFISYITQLPLIVTHTNFKDLSSVFATALELLLVSWGIAVFIRWDIMPPRDLPIRFNRARHKIYAYNFKHQWWNPFDKGKVVPVSYDWSQVRAERWSQASPLPNGVIFKWGVTLSIVAPGTNNVIDRFPLVTMGADQYAWAYICTYMQKGPSALPPPGEPKDHDDVLWCEFALRLAPKVNWPVDMDLESRTAP